MPKITSKNKKGLILTAAAGVLILLFSGLVAYLAPKEIAQSLPSEIQPPVEIPAKSFEINEESKTQTKNFIPEEAKGKETEKKESAPENKESVYVFVGEVKAQLLVAPDTIFYDALVKAQNAGTLTFSGKNYPGLGFFVTDIGTLHSGNGKDLLYYINGKEASIGVSSYTLKDGDVIEWKLE